ncbi:hypothetical protein GCM10009789_59210 [Kribbella sancticallisti]|uniref:Uncharacterized protein n=1 Tax=Kribbella sancticallisti TaxID=460087 RepID=A0ABP4Q4E4_9ACTN
MLGAALTQGPATAAPSATTAYCGIGVASVTPGGDHIFRGITATTPPTASTTTLGPKNLYPDGKARLAGGLAVTQIPDGLKRRQYVVLGTDMYLSSYQTKGYTDDVVPGTALLTKVGGGWGSDFRYFEESRYYSGTTVVRNNAYALQSGQLNRWTITSAGWGSKQVYTGYSAVKTMALISQTKTYDTFLANTYGGALYTIRIPLSGAPIVTKVRTSTWQGFESLVAADCGTQGVLLLGVDQDTGAPFLYAVGHANGTATVINGLGRVPRTYADVAYFRNYGAADYDNLFGE